jgi:hypothetical protein
VGPVDRARSLQNVFESGSSSSPPGSIAADVAHRARKASADSITSFGALAAQAKSASAESVGMHIINATML